MGATGESMKELQLKLPKMERQMEHLVEPEMSTGAMSGIYSTGFKKLRVTYQNHELISLT